MIQANHYIGKPCNRGHDVRYVSSRKCVECMKAISTAWATRNPERQKVRVAAWATANPDKEKARHVAYRLANPEKGKACSAAWDRANKGRVKAKSAAWDRANPERKRANNMVWRKANPEKAKAYSAKWQKANPAACNANTARRQALKLNAPGRGVSAAQWQGCLAESLGLCAWCNERRPLTMDHIEPLALGGAHDIDNIAAACRSCNSSKRDTPLLLWLASLALRRVA